ncbi:MAG TPA: SMP-30/gluconolactonase/LRE family protein [Kofleriaceae bacterium]|nr:SMP-30/gluconolactonase/LRE family protein [Kofleriaceae bacterium]
MTTRMSSLMDLVVLRPAARLAVPLATAALAGAPGCTSPSWPVSPTAAIQLARFDGALGNIAEGLAVRGKTAYVGYAASGQIVTVDLDSDTTAPYGTLPQPVAGMGFATGMVLHGDDLFGALVSFAPDVQPGIYRAVKGGPAALFAKHPEMVFPNGMVFDDAGQMYITDSAAGAVFRASAAGAVTKWASGPALVGGKDSCGAGNGVGVPFDVGANGIAIDDGALIVTNTDHGALVRIPIQADGSAGAPAEIAGPSCAELNGADGLAIAPNGDYIVAVNHQNKLARVDRTGRVSTLLAGGLFDFPTSVTFEGGALYVGNFAFFDAKNPGVLRIR